MEETSDELYGLVRREQTKQICCSFENSGGGNGMANKWMSDSFFKNEKKENGDLMFVENGNVKWWFLVYWIQNKTRKGWIPINRQNKER